MTRALAEYTLSRASDGLATGIVWLDTDATEAENTLKRIRHALPRDVPIGISPDGKEGPGNFGLNRNVALTILVANEGVVTGNFALVQPSMQADLPKVFEAIVRLVGGKAPNVSEFQRPRESMQRAGEPDPQLRGLIRPVIRLDATAEDVDRAAQAVESYLENNKAAQKDVGRIANTIIDGGRLTNYGTPRAQEYLQKWAERYGGAETSDDKSTNRESDRPTPETSPQ
jgi:hypothetical protein